MSTSMSTHQKRIGRALSGNHGVWFHPFKELVAVWYGDKRVSIYNSRTWEVEKRRRLPAETEDCAAVVLGHDGFTRAGPGGGGR